MKESDRIIMAKKPIKKPKQSNKLKLSGPAPDYSKYKIMKNQDVPDIRQTSNHWDHLITKLDKGDAIEMDKREAISLTNRARALGYVIVSRKREDNKIVVWFGGLKK